MIAGVLQSLARAAPIVESGVRIAQVVGRRRREVSYYPGNLEDVSRKFGCADRFTQLQSLVLPLNAAVRARRKEVSHPLSD